MYTPIHTKNDKKDDPFVCTILLLSFLLSLGTLVFFIVEILPILHHFDSLISSKIPNELDFYHEIAQQHNHTITIIENTINDPVMFKEIKTIFYQMQRITSELNITQIQDNINQIAMILNQIIHH